MLFRIVCVLILLAASYVGYEFWRQHDFYKTIQKPQSKFAVLNQDAKSVVIVDFVNYGCLACRTTSKMLIEYAKENPDIKLVVRPVPFEGQGVEEASKIVMAAGTMGHFWDFHDAIINFTGETNLDFFKETAALYDVDYAQMLQTSEGNAVFELLKNNAAAAAMTGLQTTPAVMVGKSFYQPQGILTLPELIRMVHFEKTGKEM